MLVVLRRLRMWSRRTRLYTLCGLVAASFVILCLMPRIRLWPGYHDFADRRSILGIPNAFDVLSNVPFLLVGGWGSIFLLRKAFKRPFQESGERIPYFVFFVGVALTGLGSGYYHLAPNDERLPWDLLPLTFSFVSLVAAIIAERISSRAGLMLLGPLLALGATSVLYWYSGQRHGQGDLRFYLYVQFFPAVAIAATILLFPPKYTRTKDLGIAFGLYVLAKLFEVFDNPIYSLGTPVSGHALKHLTAGVASYWILRMLQRRTELERGGL